MLNQANLNQLTLHLEPKNDVSFDYFCWGEHRYWQDEFLNMGTPKQKERFYYLWGEEGSGKSHLLQACCHHLPTSQSAVYLPLKIYHDYGPTFLDGIEHQTLIAIDDIDSVCQHPAWEEGLFHLINRIRQHPDKTLILSGRQSPLLAPCQLPDLKSRLHLGLTIPLPTLEDAQKIETLQSFAKRRGIDLPDKVVEYLMHRYDRNMHNLIRLIRTLDQASLAAKRKITIPFIKMVLNSYTSNSATHAPPPEHHTNSAE